MPKSTDQQINNYEQGAAESRQLQVRMEAAGNTSAAKLAAQSVDANLDRVNELKGRR
ncbi:hypothetical protein [Streptomyces sp. NBC_01614]|uniref:hypothetical protein n=1 Tax=Streptomyces sp. NBC_01614 TaxID=2975897 RepID=UPI00386EE9AA